MTLQELSVEYRAHAQTLSARVKEKGPMPAMSNDDLVKSCPTLYPSLLQVVHSAGERVAALLPPRQSGKK